MLTADLVVTDNGSATKPGAEGAKTYALVASLLDGSSLRRISANAITTPHELSIKHARSGKAFAERIRSAVRLDIKLLNTDLALTGGIIPTIGGYFVLDRPAQSAGLIVQAHIDTVVGGVVDVLTVSGQLGKLLNLES